MSQEELQIRQALLNSVEANQCKAITKTNGPDGNPKRCNVRGLHVNSEGFCGTHISREGWITRGGTVVEEEGVTPEVVVIGTKRPAGTTQTTPLPKRPAVANGARFQLNDMVTNNRNAIASEKGASGDLRVLAASASWNDETRRVFTATSVLCPGSDKPNSE